MSLREQILSAVDIQEEPVAVPEWGVEVLVRGMTGHERARFVKSAVMKDGRVDPEKGYPELVILSVRDPKTGELVFSAADRDALMEKSGACLDAIADVAMRLSGLLPGATEDAAKN